MNEVLKEKDSAYEKGFRKPEEAIQLISERMLTHRARVELTLRPYFKQEHMALTAISQMAELDLNYRYPDAKIGDCAYIKTNAWADRDCEAALTIAGNACIWLNGKEVYQNNTLKKPLCEVKKESEYTIVEVFLHEGDNELLMKCTKNEQNWGLLLYIAYPRYPFRWTRDYLLSVRPMLPFEETKGMEGFAHIGPFPAEEDTKKAEEAVESGRVGYHDQLTLPDGSCIEWAPKWNEKCLGKRVDFEEVYGNSQGCGYALTYVDSKEGEPYTLELAASGRLRVFVDNENIYESADGNKTQLYLIGTGKRISILIKVPRTGKHWWMEGAVYNQKKEEVNCVPFVQAGGMGPARFLVTGPYVTEIGDPLFIPFAPEQEIQFERPYPLGNYEHGFWRMPQRETYIRPYRDGIFFGQWFYAVQVGLHGLMYAAKLTGNREQLDYYLDSIQTMADYFYYKDWDKEQFGDPTLTPRAWGLPDLDACGTIGVSLIETYEITGNPKLLPVIHAVGNAVMTHIPTFPDGTYFRVKTMWADDLYMSCPFLARLYRLTGDKTYEEQVHRQVAGFKKRLWMENEKLFSHIYFPEEEQMSGIPWGRGNGWIAVTLTEILTLLPKENSHWQEELTLFQEYMEGVKACQDETGMWHQVLNEADSYLETSCTAMFLLSMSRGVGKGWLDKERYLPCIQKAWTALLKHSVDAVGDVYGVCLGSGCAKESIYYKQLPAKKNDDHGTGIVMMAAAEMINYGLTN